ncbi:MAG: hypothetical protein J0H40_17735 [Rhizobiales bacterium]|nr:hypothetical protein [Hyphomicrobiales bacterium]
MTPEYARQAYARALGACETVTIRRYYGSGTPRSKYEQACQGKEDSYAPNEIVGPVLQGDWKIIVLAQDLEGGNVSLPLLSTDKIVVRGKELAIAGIDDKSRRVGSTLCAYVLQVRG